MQPRLNTCDIWDMLRCVSLQRGYGFWVLHTSCVVWIEQCCFFCVHAHQCDREGYVTSGPPTHVIISFRIADLKHKNLRTPESHVHSIGQDVLCFFLLQCSNFFSSGSSLTTLSICQGLISRKTERWRVASTNFKFSKTKVNISRQTPEARVQHANRQPESRRTTTFTGRPTRQAWHSTLGFLFEATGWKKSIRDSRGVPGAPDIRPSRRSPNLCAPPAFQKSPRTSTAEAALPSAPC